MNASDPPIGPKVRGRHLDRLAVVYVRQSTLHQVAEHRESADLQYQLDKIAERFPASRLLVDLARDAGMEVIKKLLAELRHSAHHLDRVERKREKLNDRLLELLRDMATGPIGLPLPAA